MITRGSKFFFGAAAVGYLTALLYGFLTGAAAHGGVLDVFSNGGLVNSIVGPLSFGWKGWVGDQIGYSVLMAFAGTMAVLGGFTSVFRDGSPEALAELQGATVDKGEITGARVDLRVVTPQGLSMWPIFTAFSAGAAIVGLAVSTVLFGIGCIGLVIAGVEWTVKAWSERATGDAAQNKAIRDHLMHPLEIPIGATLAIALVIFCMSRILLAVSKVGAVFFIIILATIVFVVAILLAARPQLKRSVLVGALLVFGVLIIGGGIVGGVAGPREKEDHSEEESLGASSLVVDLPAGQFGTDGAAVGH
jgi:hypothetical protein